MSFGLPDNFCMCFDLKKGSKIIAVLCLATSVISCVMLTIYLCSDLDKIKKEISDNSDELAEKLNENSGCEHDYLFLTFKLYIKFIFFRSAARFCAFLLLILSLALLLTSVLLIQGVKLVSNLSNFNFNK